MTDHTSGSDERRRAARYSPGDLKLNIAYPGLKGLLRPNPIVECTDFNAGGLQFVSSRKFQLDEHLVIDLCIKEECIYELSGVVCYARSLEDGYQCGICFDFDDKRMQSEEVRRTLLKIENGLRMDQEYPESIPH